MEKPNIWGRFELAIEAVRDSEAAYQVAKQHEDNARRETTSALNAMNEAHKAFDAIVAEVKKTAPSGCDWKAQKGTLA